MPQATLSLSPPDCTPFRVVGSRGDATLARAERQLARRYLRTHGEAGAGAADSGSPS